MSFTPLVSIVIPVYNGENYLREAIDSALAQTYPHTEVLVVNDGSTDDGATERIAQSYGEQIRYFSKENGGVSTALNYGIEQMRGEYFSWLSHDDTYFPDKIATQIAWLDAHPDQRQEVILYSDFDIIDQDSKRLVVVQLGPLSPEEVPVALVEKSPVHGCAMLIPRSCFDKVGRFDESLRTTQDYHLWLRLARDFRFVHISKCLISGRVHSQQVTFTSSPLHGLECREFYIWALDFLSTEEVLAGTGTNSLAQAYSQIAYSLCWNKRAFQAARHAVSKSFQQFQQENSFTRFKLRLRNWSLAVVSYGLPIPLSMVRLLRRIRSKKK